MLSLESFSALRSSSSLFCWCAFSCCRRSISSRLFCCELLVVWLNVLSRPPNKRWPRLFSSVENFLCWSLVDASDSLLGSFRGSGGEPSRLRERSSRAPLPASFPFLYESLSLRDSCGLRRSGSGPSSLTRFELDSSSAIGDPDRDFRFCEVACAVSRFATGDLGSGMGASAPDGDL